MMREVLGVETKEKWKQNLSRREKRREGEMAKKEKWRRMVGGLEFRDKE